MSRDDILEAVDRAKVSFDERQQQQGFSEQEAQEINFIMSRLAQSKYDN